MPNHRKQISKHGLIGIGRELRAEFGTSLTRDLFCRQTGIAPELINQWFGSWEHFRRKLGMQVPARSNSGRMSKAELLAHLRRLADKDGNIAMRDFCRQLGISSSVIYQRFKSWRDMRVQAGLPRMSARKPEYTNEQLLDDLLQIYFKAGRCPGFHDLKRWGGKVSATALLARFGCWKGVRIALEIHRREYMAKTDPTWSWEKEQAERKRRQALQRPAPYRRHPAADT